MGNFPAQLLLSSPLTSFGAKRREPIKPDRGDKKEEEIASSAADWIVQRIVLLVSFCQFWILLRSHKSPLLTDNQEKDSVPVPTTREKKLPNEKQLSYIHKVSIYGRKFSLAFYLTVELHIKRQT